MKNAIKISDAPKNTFDVTWY